MEQAIGFAWTNQSYLDKLISKAKYRVRTRYRKYSNLKIYEDDAGDRLPIHSIEIGMVAAKYLMKKYARNMSTLKFANALYKAIQKYGWKSGFKRVTGKSTAS